MLKKFWILGLAILLGLSLAGCGTTTETTTTTTTTTTTEDPNVTLPDLTGLSREDISSTLESLGLTVKYYFDTSQIYENEDEYDKFVMYGSGLVAGNTVLSGTEVKVYTTPLLLSEKYIYELDSSIELTDADYTGKEFIADGIGEVTVDKYVDGDTTWFHSGSQSFSVRYLGIDTPESTALYEPWGKAAAHFTQETLSGAEKIVLQAEGERQDGNGRYLAWVWYLPAGGDQFILLNLQLVELAYSKNKVSADSAFTEVLTLANWDASLTKRRVWGEIDPNYDYSKEGTQMSIAYLVENFNDYVGLKVVVSGQITRMIGQNIYLQDESGYGVYMYAGYTTSALLQVGSHVTIGALVPTYYGGSPQLSNFNRANITTTEDTYEIEPALITADEFDFLLLGSLVTMEGLTVQSISVSGTTESTSVYVTDGTNTFVVRIDSATGLDAASLGITVGSTITVTGPLSYYDFDYNNDPETYVWDMGNVQLMLTSVDDIVVE